MDNVIFSSIREAGPMGKFILLFLTGISVYVWAIIGIKFKMLIAAQRSTASLLKMFRANAANTLQMYNDPRLKNNPSPIAAIYLAGSRDLIYYMKENKGVTADGKLSIVQLDGIENSLKRAISDQIIRFEKSLIFLATASSASPFIGLFGTVWGIMGAFRAIGVQGAGSIDAVAPGIAEALITTAAGLAVAIPAMIAYNYLVDRIKAMTSEMDNFASEYVSIVEKLYMQR